MSPDPMIAAMLALTIAAAMVGGVFQSFSDFVMAGLAEAGAAGAKGMQGLNRTVMRSVFLVMLFGLVPASLGFAWYSSGAVSPMASRALWAGAVSYTALVPLVTMFGNVPMNNRLESLNADTDEGAAYWQTYLVGWTRLNTVRTLGCYLASLCFAFAVLAS